MDDKLKKLKEIKVENVIWIIYIVIIILSWYANSKEKNIYYMMIYLVERNIKIC